MRHAALAVLLLIAFPGDAAAAERHPCEPRGSRTLEANRTVRVFVHRPRGAPLARVYACSYRKRRVHFLDLWSGGENCSSSAGCTAVGDIGLSSRYVAYSVVHTGRTTVAGELRLLDLRTSRERLVWKGGTFYGGQPSAYVADLELGRGGRVAWVVAAIPPEGVRPDHYEVWKSDAAGVAMLDSSREIDPGSLALGGLTIYWMNAGAPRSATLS